MPIKTRLLFAFKGQFLKKTSALAFFTFITAISFIVSAKQHSANPYRDVGQPLTSIYDAKQHGGHNQNWTIIQATNGLIYVGHTDGVSQWDGERWFNISTPHITPVRSISEWRGQLFLGTTNDLATLQTKQTGEMVYNSLLDEHVLDIDEFGEVYSTAVNSMGVIFVSTGYSFFYDGQGLNVIEPAISSKHFVFSINNDFYYKPSQLSHIYKLESKAENGKWVFTNTKIPGNLPKQARVMEIFETPANKLLVITERHGIYLQDGDVFLQIKPPEAFAKDIQLYDAILSTDGSYYISSTYHGLFILDTDFNILRNYRGQDSISMDTIFSVSEDVQGNIWLAGIPNIVKMRPAHIISEFKAGSTSTEILSLKNTSLGIIASGNGVFKLSLPVSESGTPEFVVLNDNVNSSVDLIEYNGKLIKTGNSGIYELILDQQSSQIIDELTLLEVGLGRVIRPTPDPNEFVVSTSNGAFLLRFKDDNWQVVPFAGTEDQLVSLNLDKNNTLWLGSDRGKVYKIEKALSGKPLLSIFDQQQGLGQGPIDLFDVDGTTIISSAGKLLIERDKQFVDAQLPMFSNDWMAGSEYFDGLKQTFGNKRIAQRIWYRKNAKSGFFEATADNKWRESTAIFDSVQSGGYSDLFVTEQDILWFVRDKDEIYRVDIEQAKVLPAIAPINLRSLVSQNELIDFIGQASQQDADQSIVMLNSEQSVLRANYASTDSSSPRPIEYRTRLRHKNNRATWTNWSQETYRDFTLVSPGNYTFEVQAKDAWSRVASTQLKMNVIAPWYLSPAAYFVYVTAGVFLIIAFTWFVQKWRTLALEAANQALEEKVALRTQEVNEKVAQLHQQQILKDRFFSNVSHEFRTPLTLTIGPLEVLMAEYKTELSEGVKYLAKTALNNASKMLALVGQVLDLNRLEAGKLPLRITEHDIAELLRNISERFETWAQQNEQHLSTVNCDEPLLLWFDIDQFEKCVSNLLSNAIKYSGQGTTITVGLIKQNDQVQITVADDGVGISQGAKQRVFERFYQDKSSEQISAPGTGIGLALVKEIMDIHHGQAALIEQDNKGCCFTLTLKTGFDHFDPEQIIEPIEMSPSELRAGLSIKTESQDYANSKTQPLKSETYADIDGANNNDVTTLLVVDDNKELLNFISLRLSATYKILQANDGEEGFAVAKKELPDLVITDVNMPKMTGLELAIALKQDKETQTIPVILLTAKATKREIVEGFNIGADDYLTKPFDTSELIVRVNAQINARKLIRQTIQREQLSSSVVQGKSKVSFKDNVFSVIRQQLAEPDFNVEKLALLTNRSRDTLIRNCKKECAETPLNLIVQARMQQADKLLKENTMSISEVAYACGFESLAYFSKSYKKHRGLSPSEAIAQLLQAK